MFKLNKIESELVHTFTESAPGPIESISCDVSQSVDCVSPLCNFLLKGDRVFQLNPATPGQLNRNIYVPNICIFVINLTEFVTITVPKYPYISQK